MAGADLSGEPARRDRPGPPRARVRRFVGVVVFLAVLSLASAAEPAPGGQVSPNLLLITLDTTRADHIGCYGAKGVATPTLDGLAERGARFEEAHAHVPLTLPSHATILTGDLPSTLNLRVNGMKLKSGAETLATILKARGYWTGAFVSAVVLERERGLARGFVVYDDRPTLPPRTGGPPEERPADETTQAALSAVAKAAGPFFLWVHYYDPHYEYRPPEPYASKFAKAPYDGEIAYMDASIGKLLVGLRAQGKLADTLVVVVGDHGEGLGEHGEKQHGVFLYEYAMHVPLIVEWEGTRQRADGRPRRRGPVRHRPDGPRPHGGPGPQDGREELEGSPRRSPRESLAALHGVLPRLFHLRVGAPQGDFGRALEVHRCPAPRALRVARGRREEPVRAPRTAGDRREEIPVRFSPPRMPANGQRWRSSSRTPPTRRPSNSS